MGSRTTNRGTKGSGAHRRQAWADLSRGTRQTSGKNATDFTAKNIRSVQKCIEVRQGAKGYKPQPHYK